MYAAHHRKISAENIGARRRPRRYVGLGRGNAAGVTLDADKKSAGETKRAREYVSAARLLQRERFKDVRNVSTNADMGPREIESLSNLTQKAEETLVGAARSMKLSPRGYHRTIKLARTIADLAVSDSIEPSHMLEALQYRAREI